MGREELQGIREQIVHTAELLYQNRAEGMNEAIALLGVIQQIGNQCIAYSADMQMPVIQIIKHLIEAYQTSNVLGLADALYYETTEIVDFCMARGE